MNSKYQPNDVSCPGETIVELMLQNNVSFEELAKKTEKEPKELAFILSGIRNIDNYLALKLESIFHVDSQLWLNRDLIYRNAIISGSAKGYIHIESEYCWCDPELSYVAEDTGTKVYVHKDTESNH